MLGRGTRSTHHGPFLSHASESCSQPCLDTAKCCRHRCESGPPGVCIACQHQHSCDRVCTCGLNRQFRGTISSAAAATTSALFLSGWSAALSGRLSLRRRRGPVRRPGRPALLAGERAACEPSTTNVLFLSGQSATLPRVSVQRVSAATGLWHRGRCFAARISAGARAD